MTVYHPRGKSLGLQLPMLVNSCDGSNTDVSKFLSYERGYSAFSSSLLIRFLKFICLAVLGLSCGTQDILAGACGP